MNERAHCPYLGLRQNRAIRFAAPTSEHRCYVNGEAQDIPVDQRAHCLSINHLSCPLYTGEWSATTAGAVGASGTLALPQRGIRGRRMNRETVIYLAVLALLATLTIMWLGIGLLYTSSGANNDAGPALLGTETATSTVTPTLTLTPTPTTTATPSTTPTLTLTPSITPTLTLTPSVTAEPTVAPTQTAIIITTTPPPFVPPPPPPPPVERTVIVTVIPTAQPTAEPTAEPTAPPMAEPTPEPPPPTPEPPTPPVATDVPPDPAPQPTVEAFTPIPTLALEPEPTSSP